MTLPQPMIDTVLKISTFMERYLKNPEDRLPQPTVAIKMASEAKEKSKVVGANKTQWQVTGDVQPLPLHDKIPYWIYYRIFDREYFAEVELNLYLKARNLLFGIPGFYFLVLYCHFLRFGCQ
jgi:N-acetylglucosamine malate deacetylase 2